MLALIGIVLALLAMPGIKASMRIIEEWNQRQEACAGRGRGDGGDVAALPAERAAGGGRRASGAA